MTSAGLQMSCVEEVVAPTVPPDPATAPWPWQPSPSGLNCEEERK